MVAKKIVMTQHPQPADNSDDVPTVLSMKTSTYQRWKNLRAELELEVGGNIVGLFLQYAWFILGGHSNVLYTCVTRGFQNIRKSRLA